MPESVAVTEWCAISLRLTVTEVDAFAADLDRARGW